MYRFKFANPHTGVLYATEEPTMAVTLTEEQKNIRNAVFEKFDKYQEKKVMQLEDAKVVAQYLFGYELSPEALIAATRLAFETVVDVFDEEEENDIATAKGKKGK